MLDFSKELQDQLVNIDLKLEIFLVHFPRCNFYKWEKLIELK